MLVFIFAALPTLLLLLGFPMLLCLLAPVIVYLAFVSSMPMNTLHTVIFGGLDSLPLLSIPLFIFAGEIMADTGIAKRTLDWVLSIFGRVRGAVGLTTMGLATVLGAVAGSSATTTSTCGRLMVPSLRRSGYDERFIAGLITSCGTLGPVIPPSIAMILYGNIAEVSVPKLFIAGFLPGILIALLTCLYVTWYAWSRQLKDGEPFRLSRLVAASREGLWALLMPFAVLGGIYAGVFTPTESAAFACVYAIIVSVFIYRDMTWARLWVLAQRSMHLSALLLLLVAAATAYSWGLTVTGTAAHLGRWVSEASAPAWLMLLGINAALLLLGTALEPASLILVLTPLLVPVVKEIGIDPIHFGIIMVVNMTIGNFTPPFGVNIFVAQAQLGLKTSDIYVGSIPFFLIQSAALLMISFIPALSLWPLRFMG